MLLGKCLKAEFQTHSNLAMTLLLRLVMVVPTFLTFFFFIGPLVGVGRVVLLEGGGFLLNCEVKGCKAYFIA